MSAGPLFRASRARCELGLPAFGSNPVGGIAPVADEADLLAHQANRVGNGGDGDDGQFRGAAAARLENAPGMEIEQKGRARHAGTFKNPAVQRAGCRAVARQWMRFTGVALLIGTNARDAGRVLKKTMRDTNFPIGRREARL